MASGLRWHAWGMSRFKALVPYASNRSWTIEEARTVLSAVATSGHPIDDFPFRAVDDGRCFGDVFELDRIG